MKRHILFLALCLTCLLVGTEPGQAQTIKDFYGTWANDMDRSTYQTLNPPVSVRLAIAPVGPPLSQLSLGRTRISREDIFRDGTRKTWLLEVNNNQVVTQQGFPFVTGIKGGVRNNELVLELNTRLQNGVLGSMTIRDALIERGGALQSLEEVVVSGRRTTDRVFFVRQAPGGHASSGPDSPP